MNAFSNPVGMRSTGRQISVPPVDDWKHAWTVGDCVELFRGVPAIFKVFNRDAKVASVWHYLTLEMQCRLDTEFANYDLTTGRV